MSDALIVGLVTGGVSLLGIIVSLIGIFVSAKSTRDSVTQKMDTNKQLMQNEITHIKDEMGAMKDDIRSHNNYAKLFNENIPLIKNINAYVYIPFLYFLAPVTGAVAILEIVSSLSERLNLVFKSSCFWKEV